MFPGQEVWFPSLEIVFPRLGNHFPVQGTGFLRQENHFPAVETDLPIQGKPFPVQGNDFPGHKTALAGPEKRCNCLVNEDLREEAGCLARFARFNARLIIYGRRSRKPDKLF
jgi:hypothetical protein